MNETLMLPAPAEPAPEISPEVAEAIERVKEALLKIVDAFREIIEKIAEALAPAIKAAVEIVRKIWDAIARGLVPKKWWHLYKHAKKRRIRKKYEKRIREEDMIRVKEEPAWGDLKKQIEAVGSSVVITATGEILEGIEATQAPDIFKVDI